MRYEITVGGLDPVLQECLVDRSPVCIITGPLGSGKTWTDCTKCFNIMCEQEPNAQGHRKTKIIVIRNTYSELLTTVYKDFEDLFGDLGKFSKGGKEPPNAKFIFKLEDKTLVRSEIIFIALDRPEAIKKLRGIQATIGYVSEVKEIDKSIFDMLDLRLGRYPSSLDGGPTFYGIIGDTNQCDEDHWLYELAEEEKPEGWTFLTQPGGVKKEMIVEKGKPKWTGKWLVNEKGENQHNLPPDYYKRGMVAKADSWILVNLANEYGIVMEGKPVYKEQWNDSFHVSDTIQLIEDRAVVVGLDFGLTPSAIFGQETPHGIINILDEVTGSGMGIKQFMKHIFKPLVNEKYRGCKLILVGDPAGERRADTDEETVFKVLQDMGYEPEKANTNDPLIRWEAVRGFLNSAIDGRAGFQLHKRCKLLRKGFSSGYHLKRIQVTGEKRYTDKPAKNKYSHPHDALQYLCMWFNGDTEPVKSFDRAKFNRGTL